MPAPYVRRKNLKHAKQHQHLSTAPQSCQVSCRIQVLSLHKSRLFLLDQVWCSLPFIMQTDWKETDCTIVIFLKNTTMRDAEACATVIRVKTPLYKWLINWSKCNTVWSRLIKGQLPGLNWRVDEENTMMGPSWFLLPLGRRCNLSQTSTCTHWLWCFWEHDAFLFTICFDSVWWVFLEQMYF